MRIGVLILATAAAACATPRKPAYDMRQTLHRPRLEIYCPKPPADRAPRGACHAWGALYPVGCMYDDRDLWCWCTEDHDPPPDYAPDGERYVVPPETPPKFEWRCDGPPPMYCQGVVQNAGETPQLACLVGH
jgi:hypothetical protein